jgi:phospholipid/cholesterol/gamma-HCH transport system substrate-binding protein
MNIQQRREVGIEVLVGLFMFTVLIALGVFTIVLSRDNVFKESYSFEVEFSEINGLREGDDVYMRGMKVGRVKKAELQNGTVLVSAALDVPVSLREGYSIEVMSSSMLGGKYLKIYEGPKNAPALKDDLLIVGAEPVDLLGDMSKAVASLQTMLGSVSNGEGTLGKLLKDESVYANLESASADLAAISARLERGEGTLGRLMASDDQLYKDIADTMHSLKNISAGLEAGDGTIGKLMKEEAVYNDLRETMNNLRTMSENLAAGKGVLGKLMAEDDTVYEDLAATLAAVREISETINSGEGTLGKLVRDAKLYDEATLLVEDIRAAVDDLREASPITSFGSIVFGAF